MSIFAVRRTPLPIPHACSGVGPASPKPWLGLRFGEARPTQVPGKPELQPRSACRMTSLALACAILLSSGMPQVSAAQAEPAEKDTPEQEKLDPAAIRSLRSAHFSYSLLAEASSMLRSNLSSTAALLPERKSNNSST